jgi:hypothetical protein
MRFEGDVVYVDEETGRVTVRALGRITIDPDSVELVKRYVPPRDEPT